MAEITDVGRLEAWLTTRPPETVTLIAVRAVLRALPSLADALSGDADREWSVMVLSCLRALLAARCVTGLAKRDEAARAAAYDAASASRILPGGAEAEEMVQAARSAAFAAHSADPVGDALVAVRASGMAYSGAALAGKFWSVVSADADALERDPDHRNLLRLPLWPDGTPTIVVADWTRLKGVLIASKEGWEVWTSWYDALLAGRPLDPGLELTKALIPEDVWKQGPALVNAEIARLIDEHERKRERSGGGPPQSPGRPPPSGLEPGAHDYDPATAGLAELRVIFEGEFRDDRVEAELSRLAVLLRHRLLDASARRQVPMVLGNNMQVDHVGLHRVSVAPSSVDSRWLVTLTVIVPTIFAMTADYRDFKEGLAAVRADVEWALTSAAAAFTTDLPPDAPLKESRRDLAFRDDQDVLADLLDKERQARLRGLSGDQPAH